jgi:hypothetical protein
MKNFLFIAALIFSAATLDTFAQSTQSLSAPYPASSPVPEIATSISSGADWKLPVGSRPALNFVQQQATYVRPDPNTRFKRYVNGVVGPYALARQVAGAGIATWRNSPEEWGGQWEGFGKRVASNFGKNLIKQTTIYGLDEALKLDSHYYRSEKKDVGSKIKNAIISPVTARNSRGKRVIGVPRIVGTYTGAIVAAETWYPDRYDWKDGVRSGTISLGMNAAFNLFKEFIWKK